MFCLRAIVSVEEQNTTVDQTTQEKHTIKPQKQKTITIRMHDQNTTKSYAQNT